MVKKFYKKRIAKHKTWFRIENNKEKIRKIMGKVEIEKKAIDYDGQFSTTEFNKLAEENFADRLK